MKKTRIIVFALLAILIIIPVTAKAFAVKTNDFIYIEKDEVLDGNLYAAGQNITVEGVVTGDVIAIAQQITIDGVVEGDVITISDDLNINGQVKGNARVVASNINISGQVEKNVNIAAESAILGSNSVVGSDVLAMAKHLESRGHVLGSLHGAVESLLVAGLVDENVNFRFNPHAKSPLVLTQTAQVEGDLIYSYDKDLNVNQQVVAGEIKYKEIDIKETWKSEAWSLLIGIFSALIIGLIMVTLLKSRMKDLNERMQEKPLKSMLWGLGILIITPIICFILMLTVIGIPLALIILAIWLIMIYVSQIMVAIYFGHIIRKNLFKVKKFNPMTDMVLGVVLAWLLFMIPVIGPLLTFLAIIFGLGSYWFFKKDLYHKAIK